MTTTIITITRIITRMTMIIIMIITGITTIMIITGITTIMITTMITARNCRKPPSGCARWKPFCWPKAMSIRTRWI